jgi:hypothetical protein
MSNEILIFTPKTVSPDPSDSQDFDGFASEEERLEYLKAAAAEVERQVSQGLSVPVDPLVADYMGAFVDEAIDADDDEEWPDGFSDSQGD